MATKKNNIGGRVVSERSVKHVIMAGRKHNLTRMKKTSKIKDENEEAEQGKID